MSYTQENVQANQPPDSPSRPQQRKPRGLAMLFFLLGGLVIVGGLALLFWQLYQQRPATVLTGASTPTLTSTTQAQKTGQGDPPLYYQTVEENVAQGLHLSVEQIKAKLQAGGRGTSLSLLAAQQGISLTQLHTILLDAEQKGHEIGRAHV